MMLINGLLALGALAFTVPLAIHLLFRSRFRNVDWGAMHLLEQVVRTNRRRMQWSNLLLLLIRCLLPILLAICLARPVLTGFRSLPGDAAQSLVLVIDDSRSMAVRDAEGESRMERARREITEALSNLSRRDEVLLLRTSQLDATAASMGTIDAMSKLAKMEATGGPFDLARVIRAAFREARDASHPERRIVFVSDFQSVNMAENSADTLQQLNISSEDNSTRPAIQFWNIHDSELPIDNVYVESIEMFSPAMLPGKPTRFSARIRNATDLTLDDISVIWSIDGKDLPPQSFNVDARSARSTGAMLEVDSSGVKDLSVRVEFSDVLLEDNTRRLGVNVISEIDAVLVDGRPSSKPLAGAADFLAIALSPFAFSQSEKVDVVRSSVISTNSLVKKLSTDNPNLLVLANVANLKPDQEEAVIQFVDAGGALIVFDGDRIDEDQDLIEFLPAKRRKIMGNPDDKKAASVATATINRSYAPWSKLSSDTSNSLADVEVRAYRKLEIAASEQGDQKIPSESMVAVLMSTDEGDPLVAMQQHGQGMVVQFAIPADDSWTSLPLRRMFVPLIQQLVLDLIAGEVDSTVTTAQPMVVAISEFSETARSNIRPNDGSKEGNEKADRSMNDAIYTVYPPGGKESEISLFDNGSESKKPETIEANDPTLLFRQTYRPGIYLFRQITNDKQLREERSTIRVAEVPSEESNLRYIEPSQLESIAKLIGASVYVNGQEAQSAEQTRRYGREVWRLLLVALLIFMIAELVVQQRLARSRMPVAA